MRPGLRAVFVGAATVQSPGRSVQVNLSVPVMLAHSETPLTTASAAVTSLDESQLRASSTPED